MTVFFPLCGNFVSIVKFKLVPFSISYGAFSYRCIDTKIFFLNDCFRVEKDHRMKKSTNASEDDLKPDRLLDVVLSWTFQDVLNENLYKDQVYFYTF